MRNKYIPGKVKVILEDSLSEADIKAFFTGFQYEGSNNNYIITGIPNREDDLIDSLKIRNEGKGLIKEIFKLERI